MKIVAPQSPPRALCNLLGYFGMLITLILQPEWVFANGSAVDIGMVASNITAGMNNVAKLITAVSYVAGVGFALMGMLKLKAHKENPQQVPLGQPLTLLVIAGGLVFLPSLIGSTGQTMWGGNQLNATSAGSGVIGTL